MALTDTANRVLRTFVRYTGDGLPGEPSNASLPVGDPASGLYTIKREDMRSVASDVDVRASDAESAAAAAEAARDLAQGYAEAAISASEVPIYATAALVQTIEVPAGINAFRTNGYATVGDGGAALYSRAVSEPAHGAKIQSDDGAWWEIAEKAIDLRMIGAPTGSDVQAKLAIAEAWSGGEKPIIVSDDYTLGTSVTVQSQLVFDGGSISASATTAVLTSNGQSALRISDYVGPPRLSGPANIASKPNIKNAIKKLYTEGGGLNILDLDGRRLIIEEPIVFPDLLGIDNYQFPTTIANGTIDLADDFPPSSTVTITVSFTLNSATATRLSGATPVVGMRMIGAHVADETFISGVSGDTITLSKPAIGTGTSSPSCRTLNFALDFIGSSQSSRWQNMNFKNVEFRLRGRGSAVRLPANPYAISFLGCRFENPEYYSVLQFSVGGNGGDMNFDACQFYGGEAATLPVSRKTVAICTQSGDNHIRSCLMAYHKHSMVLHGNGLLVANTHLYQGYPSDNASASKTPGIKLMTGNGPAIVSGCYIDYCSIEINNSANLTADHLGSFKMAGCTQGTGGPAEAAIILKPFTASMAVERIAVVGNVFQGVNGTAADHVLTKVDLSGGGSINTQNFSDVHFAHNGILAMERHASPVTVTASFALQSSVSIDFDTTSAKFPFGGKVNGATSIASAFSVPVAVTAGTINRTNNTLAVNSSAAATGTVTVTAFCNNSATHQ